MREVPILDKVEKSFWMTVWSKKHNPDPSKSIEA